MSGAQDATNGVMSGARDVMNGVMSGAEAAKRPLAPGPLAQSSWKVGSRTKSDLVAAC